MGAMAQAKRFETISNNLNNSQTAGFRKDILAFKSVLSSIIGGGYDGRYSTSIPEIDEIAFDREQGEFQQTGRTFDLAIEGKGFFMLKNPQSDEILYTRAGNFSVSPTGKLTRADGNYEVLNQGLTPISIDFTAGSEVVINEAGNIYLDGVPAGSVGVADFEDYSKLTKIGGTLFDAGNADAKVIKDAVVRQGFIEGSSVNPIEEMAAMIEALRTLEANLQMIKFQDSTLDKAVNELGRLM